MLHAKFGHAVVECQQSMATQGLGDNQLYDEALLHVNAALNAAPRYGGGYSAGVAALVATNQCVWRSQCLFVPSLSISRSVCVVGVWVWTDLFLRLISLRT